MAGMVVRSSDPDAPELATLLAPVSVAGRSIAYRIVLYVPSYSEAFEIAFLSPKPLSAPLRLVLLPLSQAVAASLLTAGHPFTVLAALVRGGRGRLRRVRALLARFATTGPSSPPYSFWVLLYDRWPERALRDMVAHRASEWPSVLALVFTAGAPDGSALAATTDSLANQIAGARVRVFTEGTPVGLALEEMDEEYVALIQAGEVLPSHALLMLRRWAATHGRPPALYADEDRIDVGGARSDPLFKPEANRALMLSGTLTRGVWLFRRDVVQAYAAGSDEVWAEALRLDVWLRLYENGEATSTMRVPFLLTHRRWDAETAPPSAVARVIAAHLDRTGAEARIDATSFPLRVRPVLAEAGRGKVAVIVPSACRSEHVTRCLRRVLSGTAYRNIELTVVVTCSDDLDPAHRAVLDPVLADRRARLAILRAERFNYSVANNFGVAQTDAPYLCLLNDDVSPIAEDWLDAMLGHFADPAVGAVGAMLYYANDTIQHGGVIVGLAGLAEHASRFLPRGSPGYAHRAMLSQEVSAATGACLLVRRAAFEQVGGLDETYPVAFNDVDFCLRLREAGWRIVLSAEAQLYHYESLSLGHHFSGERAALERFEVGRMRRRWRAAVAADPFHNPNLSLIRGNEWQLASPPRVRKEVVLELRAEE